MEPPAVATSGGAMVRERRGRARRAALVQGGARWVRALATAAAAAAILAPLAQQAREAYVPPTLERAAAGQPGGTPPRLPDPLRVLPAAAALRGGVVEAEPAKVVAADPFKRLSAVLRQTKLDGITSLLDGSVDIPSVQLRRAAPALSGKLEETDSAKSLWARGGALIIAVRRPGCWLCREEAFALARMVADNPLLSQVRLVAVVKEDLINQDGTSEVERFMEYFPNGEVFVDESRGIYRALGGRSLFEVDVREGLAYAKQRVSGLKEFNIQGNLNGVATDPFLLGGILLVAPSSQVVWVHQEGKGPVEFEDLEMVLKELAETVSASQASQRVLEQAPDRSWIEWAVDSWLSEFK